MNELEIIVDADACPVKEIIITEAKKYSVPVTMVTDTSHILDFEYCNIITVDKGHDSADIAIANLVRKGDIAVTQDYGLACMLIAKGGYVLNQNGLLMRRHISAKQRRGGKRSGHIKPRTAEDNERFRICLENLILKLIQQ